MAWSGTGATLSDKSARKEFGLSRRDILKSIRYDNLLYRENSISGNRYLRLLRHEVEKLVAEKHSRDNLARKKLKNELTKVNKEPGTLKAQVRCLELRRDELLGIL